MVPPQLLQLELRVEVDWQLCWAWLAVVVRPRVLSTRAMRTLVVFICCIDVIELWVGGMIYT
jgi:hypothetical protein